MQNTDRKTQIKTEHETKLRKMGDLTLGLVGKIGLVWTGGV